MNTTVTSFATLLDKQQFTEAGQLLSDDCTYQYDEGKYQGNTVIANIFQRNHLGYLRYFDEVSYSSKVSQESDDTYRIDLIDKLRKGPRWHETKSYCIVTLADDKIIDIKQYGIAGEAEALRAFHQESIARGF